MKATMSEKVKHRIVGLMVITSLAVIFLPAVLKKSNYNFEKNIKVALQLPKPPKAPKVALPSNKEMFNSARVVHVKPVQIVTAHRHPTIAKAEPLEIPKI